MSYLESVDGNGVSNGNNTTLTVPWPTGTQSGDGALLWWVGTDGVTWNAPTGITFTQRSSTDWASGNLRARLYSRVADGTESGDVTLTHGTANRQSAVLLVYRYTDDSDPIHALEIRGEASGSSTHASAEITPTINGVSLLTLIAERQSDGTSSWIPPTGYTERADVAEVGSGGTAAGAADDGLGAVYVPNTAYRPPDWTSGNDIVSNNVLVMTVALAPGITQPVPRIALAARAVARSANW